MIDAIELSDWEGHKESLLEFSDTVTVILGKSHNGKSSIIRGFDWILNNRPVSTAYFPRGKKNPESNVSISTEDGFISRIRNKKKNFYETEDGVFTALRTGVPDEVKDFLGMTEINIQLQKDVHYMLTDTPGKRAKRLNEIAGLSEMDDALEKVNKFHRLVKSQYDAKTIILNGYENDHKELEWIEKAKVEFDKLLALDKTHKDMLKHIESVDRILNNIETIEYQQSQLPDTKAIKDIDAIKVVDDSLYSIDWKVEEIEKRLKTISKLKTEISRVNLPADTEMTNLDTNAAELDSKIKVIATLKQSIRKINSLIDDSVLSNDTVQAIKTDKTIFKNSFDICPFCRQEIEESY